MLSPFIMTRSATEPSILAKSHLLHVSPKYFSVLLVASPVLESSLYLLLTSLPKSSHDGNLHLGYQLCTDLQQECDTPDKSQNEWILCDYKRSLTVVTSLEDTELIGS